MLKHFIRALSISVAVTCTIAPTNAQTLTNAKLRLDWRPAGNVSPFYFGKSNGYYKEQGIDLDIIAGSGSSDTLKQVGAGAVNFGLVDALVVLQGVEQRLPVTSIAIYFQRTPIVIFSPKEKPITHPKQLAGNVRLGVKKGTSYFQALPAVLAANNMTMDQLTLVDVGFTVQPLLVKQVDAMMGYAMNEPLAAEAAGMPVHVLPVSEFGLRNYGTAIIVNSNFMKANGKITEGFVRATLKSIAATASDPKSAIDALTAAVPELMREHQLKVLARTVPYWTGAGAEKAGMQTAERWAETIEVARRLNVIEKAVTPEAVFTNAYLK
jgi:NitT/TauT family transport system substrate-binding protein